ncbi:WecB/TagA/CpsF family glycosyltransferase [Pedobacter sp. LMG 31464]|uniref:WecB/TagA/CpsF family glycosyltransferase n=1 Tax=Pedobacter planticolens TaxID=2679964 RepID=A0A923DXK9_9SPHI|nr:WecB/TagA/CpsF family glycosyltransferase [Pedobacter planticolens]MBB2145896.1 WecB/TagA/CpsF family glycosyltransferase [Pedobacter planticolens]
MCLKVDVFGVKYSVTDYDKASSAIIENAKKNNSFGVSALAVHGLIECYNNPLLKEKVNKLNLIVPDGQPVKWVMNSFHNTALKDRVYGPTLTLEVLKKANKEKLSIYLYGSKQSTLDAFSKNINEWFPEIKIVGIHPDRFRDATESEDVADIDKINKSGAHVVLVGRGCPRQEIWVSDHLGKVNAAMMAVGAAFDFHAGSLPQAPTWMQKNGLEWLFRLVQEPKRLWRRYLFTNSKFIMLFIKQKLKN